MYYQREAIMRTLGQSPKTQKTQPAPSTTVEEDPPPARPKQKYGIRELKYFKILYIYIYIYTMHTNGFLKFLGWAFLTFTWLHTNLLFFGKIANAIDEHNKHIKRQAIEEYKNQGEDESEDELFQKPYIYTMSDNKLVKSTLDATTVTGLVAGIGRIGKKKKQSKKTSQPTPVQISSTT